MYRIYVHQVSNIYIYIHLCTICVYVYIYSCIYVYIFPIKTEYIYIYKYTYIIYIFIHARTMPNYGQCFSFFRNESSRTMQVLNWLLKVGKLYRTQPCKYIYIYIHN